MKHFLALLITIYQKTLSLDHGWFRHLYPQGYCRYHPTCSEYTKQSILRHGVLAGSLLGVARVSRCHPWAPIGADPVLNRENN